MRKLRTYLVDFIRADFKPGLYGCTALFLAVCIAFNYAVDLEDTYIDAYRGSWIRFVLFLGLDAFVYYSVTLLWLFFHQRLALLRTLTFWLFTSFGMIILAWWQDFTGYQPLATLPVFESVYRFAFYCFSNLSSGLTIWVPLALFYRWTDAQPSYFYGFRPDRGSLRMYGTLLLLMVPLIGWASFQPSFLETYPIYKGWGAAEALGVSEWVTALGFEACYGFDFVSTELLLRGFLVIGMTQVLGRGAVLPMVAVYACIHFGKPLGETLGSVLGGYILGILAYESRTIWGGIAIHLGVAWLMELGAFLQTYSQQRQ
ncbi:type II CAAX prenyl endopeptidase Rce1 family protein [Siphonobacter sp.]|uniref:CPBP family glutamic-type intramembrane protease n=1 Tax=Siphonobacter sp. TaxID=1869184 RepID=UPI003B3BD933